MVMKTRQLLLCICLMVCALPTLVFGQSTGDFRTHQTGNWGDNSTWERYNGSSWETPAPSLPDTLHLTTFKAGHVVTVSDTEFVGNSVIEAGGEVDLADSSHWLRITHGTLTVYGLLRETGTPPAASPYAVRIDSASGAVVIGNGGTFQEDQDGGHIPRMTWADGSTLLITGIVTKTNIGSYPGQSYYNIVWNCPAQTANTNMNMAPDTNHSSTWDTTTTIRGNITVLSTGLGRAYFTGPDAGTDTHHNVSRIIVMGNINVLNGSILSSNGTSKAYTDIIVTVLGNITVRDSAFLATNAWQWSQLAISRGSQGTGLGTSIWLIKSDSVYYGRKTSNQNSTDPNTGSSSRGKFVFCKPGTQIVTLGDSIGWSGECNMQFGDSSAVTIINVGNSTFTGSACTQRIKHNATVVVDTGGFIGGGTNQYSVPSSFGMDSGATLVMASQAGIRATGMGSSGAVRVSGTRDYGMAANFVYDGSSHQRLGSGFPLSASKLEIDNPLGAYIDSVAGFTISESLKVLNGYLDLNGATVTLGPDASLSEVEGNTVTGDSGVIMTTRTLVSPSASVNIAGLGVSVGSSANLGSTIIRRGHSVQGGTSIKRYFDLVPANNGALNATLVYKYDPSELRGQSIATLSLWKSPDDGATWESYPSTNTPATYTLTATGVDSLSRWTAADEENPLGQATKTLSISAGWNMVSLPLRVINGRRTVIFPAATSKLFAYEGAYTIHDSMECGVGYWLKFDSAGTVDVRGSFVAAETLHLDKNWNMIGGISLPVSVDSIVSLPGGLLTSPFYGYNGSYLIATSLDPGKAYWIRANDTGTIIVSLSPGPLARTNRLRIIRDSELPPPPPGGMDTPLEPEIPRVFALGAGYPNPFNPSTQFVVSVPQISYLDIAIYNVIGQKIRTLLHGETPAGYHTVRWDGVTDQNVLASSGIYFVRMNADGGRFVSTRKIMLMK